MRRRVGEKDGKHWAEHVQRSCGSLELQKAEAKSRQVRLEQRTMRGQATLALWATLRCFVFILQAMESC